MKHSKIKKNFIILVIFLLTLNYANTAGQWCWTKSMANDPNWVFNADTGNINWGYCNMQVDEPKMANYSVELRASTIPMSVMTSAVSIEIFGSLGALDQKQLTLGSPMVEKDKFQDKDVGVLNKITMFIRDGWYRCQDIKVSKGSESYNFRCVTGLGPCLFTLSFSNACMTDLFPDGDTEYSITIKVSSTTGSGTESPVLVSLMGKKAKSDYFIFSEKGMETSLKLTKSFFLNDLGDLMGFSVKLEKPGSFKPEYIMVSQPITNQHKQWSMLPSNFGPTNGIYTFDTSTKAPPAKNTQEHAFILNNGSFNPKQTNMFEQLVNWLGSLFEGSGSSGGPGSMEKSEELQNIIDLTCDQQMINPSPDQIIFGDDYPTQNINYMNIFARCPANCHKTQGDVSGMGIHPESSPICLAAMIDNAISDYGGVFSLSIYPGLKDYSNASTAPTNLKKNINISSGGAKATKKSYIVARIDNPDLVEKDIRILDHDGKLNNEGRLEVRVNGQWKTICHKRLTLASARLICQELGYNDGRWNEDSDCDSFRGEDHCGSQNYKAMFSDIDCQPNHRKFADCTKKIADELECGRPHDAIIECTNVSYDVNQQIEQGTVKLENVENDKSGTTGRLEYYLKEFGSICNLGATDKTAELACKKMGYIGGVVKDSNTFRRSKTDSSPINAILNCRSTDNSLNKCKLVTKDINCDHSQDLVIKCTGEGDYSGRSQYPKTPSVGPPNLGRLGMISITAECKTYGNNSKFRGDPGSIYYVTCPADCNKVGGTVWGTGVYTLDSSLCLAAIHAGVIKGSGGSIVYIKTWGQKSYRGTYANGVATNDSSRQSNVSFTFSVHNVAWQSSIRWAESKSGTIYLEKSTSVSLKKMSKFHSPKFSSFMSMGSSVALKGNPKIPEPVWEWLESDSTHKFSNIGALQITNKPMDSLKSFSILIQLKMIEFQGKAFLFSCKESKGYNVFIDKRDNLFIGANDGPDSLDTNLLLPVNQMVVISITYDNEKVRVQLIGNDVKTSDFNKKQNFMQCSKFGIGRHANNDQDYFYGMINFIQFFNFAIEPTLIPILINTALKKPKSTAKVLSQNTLDKRQCVSSCTNAPIPGTPGAPKMPLEADPYPLEIKISADNLIQGQCGLELPDSTELVGVNSLHLDSIHKLLIQNTVDISNTINRSSNYFGSDDENSSNYGPGNSSNNGLGNSSNNGLGNSSNNGGNMAGLPVGIGSNSYQSRLNISVSIYNSVTLKNMSCEATLRDKQFDGSVGEKFRIKCDEDCSVRKDLNVFGSIIYSPDSSVCKAAYHSGVLDKGTIGYIIVQLVDGKKIYNQSMGADGSLSSTSGGDVKSFIVRSAVPPIKIDCYDTATKSMFASANPGKTFLVLCPSGCSKIHGEPVFGEEVYADVSPICQAGIHWGIITDRGGEFEFMIDGSQTTYKGTKGFGVESQYKGQWIRSYRILGTRATIFKMYKEDFVGKFSEKYDIYPDPTLYTVNTQGWSFNEQTTVVANKDSKLWVITNQTKITSNSSYGTWITLKNGEFVNGRFRSSWNFSQQLVHATMFRFEDRNNFYAVEFNLENKYGNNIKLIKTVQSAKKVVAEARRNIFINKWYKLTILMDFDDVTVLLQSDNLRMEDVIFKEKMSDIYRGTIGFASNGATDYKISGVEIDNHFQKGKFRDENKNKRNYYKILSVTALKDRKNYCSNEFLPEDPNLKYCELPRVYCRIRCDDLIDPIENIANYNCYRDCVKTVHEEDLKLKGSPQDLNRKQAESSELEQPYVGLKVDFMPPYGTSDQHYTPGVIKDVKSFGGKFRVDVEYEKGENLILSNNIEYPGDGVKIKKCRSKLMKRSDCEDQKNKKQLY